MSIDTPVTIITTVYKYRESIVQCIESVMIQNYPGFQYIIIDDGPNSIIDQDIRKMITRDDIYFKIIHNDKNMGISETLNIAIKQSTGEIIFNLADDDQFYDSDVIRDWVDFFENTGALVVTAKMCKTYENGEEEIFPSNDQFQLIKTMDSRQLFNQIASNYNIIFGSVTAKKKSLFEKVGYYDSRYRQIEDYPHNLAILRNGIKIEAFDRIVVRYGVDGRSNLHNIDQNYYSESDMIFKNEILPYSANKLMSIFHYRWWKLGMKIGQIRLKTKGQ